MKVNATKLRRDAYDCRYSHMVMEPNEVMGLCDEIVKLRKKVTELGGDPFALDEEAPPLETPGAFSDPPMDQTSVTDAQPATRESVEAAIDGSKNHDSTWEELAGVDDPANYPEGHKGAQDYMRKRDGEEGVASKTADSHDESEPPQPAETEQSPTHTDDSEQQ